MSDTQHIRLGTRASKLALWQSNWVKAELERRGHSVELIRIKTLGDVKTGSLAQIGGQGLFTKQLQVALLGNEIDLAVHSLKDLPTEDCEGLSIAAIPPRETTEDALCFPEGVSVNSLDEVAEGATIGTGSVRRAAQLRHLRPDLKIQDIRGNVDTRLEKLDAGVYDAIVLAAAGLTRLELADRIGFRFAQNRLLPAVGQGALGLEVRLDNEAVLSAVKELNDPDSYAAALAERAMLKRLFAGCLAPVGARCGVVDGQLSLTGVVLSCDGTQRIEASQSAAPDAFAELGKSLAEKLIADGADVLLSAAKA